MCAIIDGIQLCQMVMIGHLAVHEYNFFKLFVHVEENRTRPSRIDQIFLTFFEYARDVCVPIMGITLHVQMLQGAHFDELLPAA